MQGVWIHGERPRSKKQIREQLAEEPKSIYLEATSVFGNEFGGRVTDAPDGEHHIVDPDPHRKRSFYGTFTVKNGEVSFK